MYTAKITFSTRPSTLKKIIIIGIALVCGIFFGLYNLSSNNNKSVDNETNIKPVDTTELTTTETNKTSIVNSDLSLGGVELGYSIDQMHNILGKEIDIDDKGDYKFYNYNDIQVGVKNGKVDALVSNSSVVETKRGLHQGSSLQDVLNKYGDNYYKTDYNDLILYEYTFAADNNNGILRFAINKSDNLVNYISVRIPEEIASNNNSDEASEKQFDPRPLEREYDGKFTPRALGTLNGLIKNHHYGQKEIENYAKLLINMDVRDHPNDPENRVFFIPNR